MEELEEYFESASETADWDTRGELEALLRLAWGTKIASHRRGVRMCYHGQLIMEQLEQRIAAYS
jgi:hypothetical protein